MKSILLFASNVALALPIALLKQLNPNNVSIMGIKAFAVCGGFLFI